MIKKNFRLILLLAILIASMLMMWNLGIASDNQLTVGQFIDQFGYLDWSIMFLTLSLVVYEIFTLVKNKSINS